MRGPRQIGKTTAQLHGIEDLLANRVEGRRILRVRFDELRELRGFDSPILRIVDWCERVVLGCTFNEAGRGGVPAYVWLEEVQNLEDWAAQLQALVDSSTVQVVVTGSSALRIEAGRDTSSAIRSRVPLPERFRRGRQVALGGRRGAEERAKRRLK